MADIRTIKKGDKSFSAENFNRLVRNGRNVGKVSTDKYIRYNTSPMGQHFALNRRDLVPFWRVEKYATSGSSGIGVRCSSGVFAFNGLRLTTSQTDIAADQFQGTNTRYWLYISTSSTGGTADPYIYPDAASIHVSASGQSGMDESFNDNKRFPIAAIDLDATGNIENITQANDGPFSVNVDTPDGETRSASHPVRRTLERNSSNDLHKGEWQMYDVDTVQDGYRGFPSILPDAQGDGVLFWIYNDAGAPLGSSQKSIETRVTSSGTINQIYEFEQNTASSMQGGDLLLFKSILENEVQKADKQSLINWLSSSIGGGPIASSIDHNRLNFAPTSSNAAGANIDHRPKFWCSFEDDDYVSARSFHTAGEVLADDFKLVDSSTTNLWNGERFGVLVNGDVTIYAEGTGQLLMSSSTAAVIQSATTFDLIAGSSFKTTVGTTGDLSASVWRIGTTAATSFNAGTWVNLNPAGALKINGSSGVVVATRIRKGIDIGSTHEVQFKDLSPLDYVLVRRA